MDKDFTTKWLSAVDKNNSVLCAGLDPAEFEMGRGAEGLPTGASKRDWALKYVEAVAPYSAAIKPNYQYWKGREDVDALRDIIELSHEKGLVVIDDSKLADIGSTNDAGMFYSGKNGFDAVTYSPFAGNIAEAAKQGKARNLGIICMCLMSNPEFERVKNMLVPVKDEELSIFSNEEPCGISNSEWHFVKNYKWLAKQSAVNGLAGVVIGAPSKKNHLTENEIYTARKFSRPDTLALCPGVGKQSGEAGMLWTYFSPENVIVNVGRALMFPDGGATHAETAKYFRDLFNKDRFSV